MSETIHAVYEQGVLRPLTPLHLPEHTQVEISINPITNAEEERQRVRQALIAGGYPTASCIYPYRANIGRSTGSGGTSTS
jgi:predicted DNA-binding antitoxin AbrB/MazE fold protein